MAKISSHTGRDLYRVEIRSASGNIVIADEPADMGGKDSGFSPKELLAASLAACTSATVRMYADRKGWDLEAVDTEISLHWDQTTLKTSITREVNFSGNLDAAQRSRLLAVANACPLHKMLTNQIHIETTVAD